MYEIVEGLHKALHLEARWAFVLVAAGVFAVVGGVFAWIIDTGYRNSPEYIASHSEVKQDPKPQAVAETNKQQPTTAKAVPKPKKQVSPPQHVQMEQRDGSNNTQVGIINQAPGSTTQIGGVITTNYGNFTDRLRERAQKETEFLKEWSEQEERDKDQPWEHDIQRWKSNEFIYLHLPHIRQLRDEAAQLHFRNDRIDQVIERIDDHTKLEESAQRMGVPNTQLYISPYEVQEVIDGFSDIATRMQQASVAASGAKAANYGSMTFLDNQGEIQKARIGKVTMQGSPTPGTNAVGIKNETGAKMGSLDVKEAYMYVAPPDPIPPAPTPGSDFHSRISELRKEIHDWKINNPSGPMSNFHEQFGDRLKLITEQLRACDGQRTKYIYDRENDKVNTAATINLTLGDLLDVDGELPQNEQQITCANK
jgi:hypothetical protein